MRRIRIDEARRFESPVGTSHARGRPEPGKGRGGCGLVGGAVVDELRNRVLEMRLALLEDPLDAGMARHDAKQSGELLSQGATERFQLPGLSGWRPHTVSKTDSTACAKLPHSRRSCASASFPAGGRSQ